MKLNRTDWLVIIGGALLIGLASWWPKPPAPVQPTKAAETAAVEPSKIEASKPDPVITAQPGNAPAPSVSAPEQKFLLKNSEVAYTFTTKGGGIRSAQMLASKDLVELNSHGKAAMGALGSGFNKWDDLDYKMVSQTGQGIAFEAESPEHLIIRKEYSFTEGKGGSASLLDFTLTFTNKAGEKIIRENLFLYTGAAHSLRPDEIVKPGFCWNDAGDPDKKDTSYFGSHWMGGVTTDLQKPLDRLRWAGVMSRFYAQLICTKEDQAGTIWSMPFLIDHSNDEFKNISGATTDNAIHGGLGLPKIEIGSGESKKFDLRIYLGPKIFHDLKHIDNVDPDRQLRYVMFYGWFSWISRFLIYWLRNFHDWCFQSWGAAIILLTIFVRSILWPVQARANSTMKRMGLLSPKLKELQAKFKDDPQKQQAEMMKLYKEYGVNPLGGCLPMMVQIPIFFGFYSALQVAAELRGQSFLWVPDLSLPDTVAHFAGFAVNPLPLIMVVTNVLQMKLTPQPQSVDKAQQRMMMFMPLIFLFICYNFASALALYWTTQNIFSILQAQIQLRFGKDVALTKRPPGSASGATPGTPQSSFGSPNKKKKDKSGPPRLGGGSTRSTRNKD
ncbi:MAG: YidC/Oxa1 family insertase periplasmic-domain containing protein [Verrucomicrobia bacterium]|nr:YidC/Oxa1 family insertase periplasmic-domain containing protein [Verrucomicrobiota bacterium]